MQPEFNQAKLKLEEFCNLLLTDAFNINLTNEECRIPAEKIYQILYDN